MITQAQIYCQDILLPSSLYSPTSWHMLTLGKEGLDQDKDSGFQID
jgi:hypothetical protein